MYMQSAPVRYRARRSSKTSIGRCAWRPSPGRQTTLARSLIPRGQEDAYFNWDSDEDRERLLTASSPHRLWVLMKSIKRRWRGWLKGLFDKNRDHHQIVTGSVP